MLSSATNAQRISQGASLASHCAAWDFVAHQYAGGSALPAWGTRGELEQERVLPPVQGARVLEIGFGSGDSMVYLLQQGAGSVTGIDFSKEQYTLARKRITQAFRANPAVAKKAHLRVQSMDAELPAGHFDIVVAVYSVGWSEQPGQLFQNIYNRLKPGGYFCFSWDHYLSRIVEQTEQGIAVTRSYHEPMPWYGKIGREAAALLKHTSSGPVTGLPCW